MSSSIDRATVRRVRFPLVTPYRLSSGDLHLFDPFVIELCDANGDCGWGEAMIVPGYTHEAIDSAWQVACMLCERVVGRSFAAARQSAREWLVPNPGVASAMLAAIDMLAREPLLCVAKDVAVPLLAPCQAHETREIQDEVDRLIDVGFRTLKVKVGYRWRDDLERVARIQAACAGRATLRLDANRGFGRSDGIAFASRLDPRGIELFEQPCASNDWAANAAVAAASKVPVMLDESINDVDDIERAARLPNVGFVKLKLKKIGSNAMLRAALDRIRALGMTPVMGDGVSIEIGCWMEACVAVHTLDNAGEMNGFLKTRERLFANPLEFDHGAIRLRAGYWPEIDRKVLDSHTVEMHDYRARMLA
jgi:L-alanine-DL-glutamate epimerase-like enolase superfamily enzyme